MRYALVLLLLAATPLFAQDALSDPAKATETAPDKYTVEFDTTKGKFQVEITRAWSPNGADRFYYLVKHGYYKDIAFFRVIEGFMAQFGMHGDPKMHAIWGEASFPDDPPAGMSNTPGTLSFAKKGTPNSRSTQLFINMEDNSNLDGMGFTPFGTVLGDGLAIVRSLYNGYGDGMPMGRGPDQGMVTRRGNGYLKTYFPRLDYINNITLVK